MVEEIDYKRKKRIVEYIKGKSEILSQELEVIYKNNPEALKNVLIQAQMAKLWMDSWDSGAILTELLTNQINALTSKKIYTLFRIWNDTIASEFIKKTFEFICATFPEYHQVVQPKDEKMEDSQNKFAIGNHNRLMAEKYHKTTVIRKIVDILLDRNKKGIIRCQNSSCELKTPIVDFGKSTCLFDKYTLDTALLIDALEYLRQLFSVLIKSNKKFTKSAKELKAIRSGIMTFYFYLDKILFNNESSNPKTINIGTINESVKEFLRKRLEDTLIYDWAKTLMDEICELELRFESTSESKNDQNNDVVNSLKKLTNLYWHIGEIREKLIQETLNRTEISCTGINARIKEIPNELPITIVEWVKQRPIFINVEVA